MKRKLVLIVGSVCIIAAGRVKPVAAQADLKPVPKPKPYIFCNTACTNSSACESSDDACIVCIHPQNKCG